ncbi:MAG TPA: sialidase family protein [Jiangellaceae bacterium]|nr:sialidase family protein [Jiangellaceae bacterium]
MRWKPRHLVVLAVAALVVAVTAPAMFAGHATDGVDAKVTDDNNNVDGGLANVTPSKDAQNRQANETTVSISPRPSPVTGGVGDLVAAGGNDYRMVPHTADVWFGFYLSFDGGATWFGAPPFPNGFNTMVPGFPTDTSAAGTASPLKGLDASGDPVVRFGPDGDLYLAAIGFNRNFDQPDRPLDTVVYVAKYDFTPGTAATASSPTSAGSPPHFTYAGTTVVDRGAVGFAVPGVAGFVGTFTDKEWMEVDGNSSAASRCAGNVYVAHTNFHASFGSAPIMFSTSTDGGASFSHPQTISTGGPSGTPNNQGVDISVASDGTIYVAYSAFKRSTGLTSINLVKSTDCGRKWSQPVVVGSVNDPQAPGVAFRTPTFAFVAVDDTDPSLVYVAYQSLSGDYDIYAQRSTNGGATWGSAAQVNTDPGARHQIFPTIDVSNHAVHVAWYDFRNSVTAANEALDVYYACTNCDGNAYPTFSHETRVTDVSHNGNCLLFGGGTAAFHGDYNELDAYWDGANHHVHVAWADNRDVSPCDLDPAAGPPTNNTGNRNQNIYADHLTVAP